MVLGLEWSLGVFLFVWFGCLLDWFCGWCLGWIGLYCFGFDLYCRCCWLDGFCDFSFAMGWVFVDLFVGLFGCCFGCLVVFGYE